ncbi:hypothetical protein ACFL27_25915 [candidate division CSSED10-310 bacterium]|uniref:CARDB domain-containing protein n=1 Tax=candidate division CSSED10-310 bacterium TaxID=2855610 RepID=A0ABV6Z5C6_UNCC1
MCHDYTNCKSILIFWATFLLIALVGAGPCFAAGELFINLNAPYNLVVDSNVGSPSTYAPEVGTVGVQVCNYGDAPLTDVIVYIGDYSAGTPGVYPVRDSTDAAFIAEHPLLASSGDYSLTHVAGTLGTADASRWVGDLAVGECQWQYFLITYPQCEDSEAPPCSGEAVWGNSSDFNDDLWLNLDRSGV